MPQPLTAEKREELFQQWSKGQCVALVSRVCGVHENTVRRYRKLEDWPGRLTAITTRAAAKADTKQANERGRWAKGGQLLQKTGFDYLFDKETGEIKTSVLEAMEPKDAIKAIQVGVAIEQMALGDNAGTDDKPIVIVVQDQRGVVQSLSTVPLVTDADFEGEDSE